MIMAKRNVVWLKTNYFGKPNKNAAKITCPNLGNSHNKVCVFYQTSGTPQPLECRFAFLSLSIIPNPNQDVGGKARAEVSKLYGAAWNN